MDNAVIRWCRETRVTPPKGIYCHISGIDLVRDGEGEFVVLEDNLRCPSGVSYVLENRFVLKQTFPRLFESLPIRTVDDYPERLLSTLAQLVPDTVDQPQIVVLTPGSYNSAYFEHAYLAQQMGVPLVEASDLVIDAGHVKMLTTQGPQRVDVIYRRVNDEFIDPKVFHPDSVLGVPGIMDVYKAGRVALANAPGAGVADNKVIYAFVPDMIRYYLQQDPILPNVETFLCAREDHRRYVLDNLDKLVVKPADEAGGKGILVGPHATEHAAESDGRADRPQPPRLHRAADALALPRPHRHRRQARGPTRRPAPLHPLRRRYLRPPRRPDPRRPPQGLARGQLLTGRRHQRHLGARRSFCDVIHKPRLHRRGIKTRCKQTYRR